MLTSHDSITLVVTRESNDPSLVVYSKDDILNRNVPHGDGPYLSKSSSSSVDNLLSAAKQQIPPSANSTSGNSAAPVAETGSKHRSKRAQSSSTEVLTVAAGNSGIPLPSSGKTAAKPHQNTNTRQNSSDRSPSVSDPVVTIKATPPLPMQTFAPPVVLAQDISQPIVRLETNPVLLPSSSDTVTTATAKIPSSPVVQLKTRGAPSTGKNKSRVKNNSVVTPSGESQPNFDAVSNASNVSSLFDVLERNYTSKGSTLPNGDLPPNARNGRSGSNRESYGFNSVYSHNQPYPVEVSRS